MSEKARRIVLASRPVGEPTAENFRTEEYVLRAPASGEVVLRTLWLSLDPYMRGRMSDAPSYAAPVGIDQVMEGRAISEVIASNAEGLAKGDLVFGNTGWQTHAVANAKGLKKLDRSLGVPLPAHLGVLGMPGMTAYSGLLEIGKPKPGETVVVAAASGAVGQVVGQIACLKGARAIGIAGGPDKCRFVKEELGFDECLDHRDHNLAARLQEACPKGVDVYFENVGGKVFEAVFPLFNNFARIPVCGLIAQYNATAAPADALLVPTLMRQVLTKRLNFRGFIVGDFAALAPDFQRDMAAWVRDGKIKHREYVIDGLDNAPRGLIGLLRGENFGKTVVRVAQDA